MIDRYDMSKTEYFEWLKAQGDVVDVKDIGNGLYAGIKPLLFHWTLMVGEVGDFTGFYDRWCYIDEKTARTALEAWDGTGEPTGWHRHPTTGRRRSGGDPAQEYVSA